LPIQGHRALPKTAGAGRSLAGVEYRKDRNFGLTFRFAVDGVGTSFWTRAELWDNPAFSYDRQAAKTGQDVRGKLRNNDLPYIDDDVKPPQSVDLFRAARSALFFRRPYAP